ncbi:hypothetical protein IDJ75_00965 [Mucilaginibacter rigui]|uniref:VCBS repeat-containing protein n=1 Tax=Mucilaginibacter rigui TaxID=534635 RepID=A0ABR7WZS5_9SPHI|nr:hypothetical protein [Mucilaginibacter rigui]MBD1383833.1 hypothetical protein [Mucilaginibacter rigui]
MRKLFLILAIGLVSCKQNIDKTKKNTDHSVAEKKFQSDTSPYISFPYNVEVFDWKSFEKQNNELKNRFMQSPPAELKDAYEYYKGESSSMADLQKALHIYDIDADGTDDIIFEGQSGGEPLETALILNTKQGLKVVFNTLQTVKGITLDKDKRISKLYIKDPGCCAEYIEFNKVYDVIYTTGQPKVKLQYLSANHVSTYFPEKYLSRPINFEVLNDNYKLRIKPIVDDKSQMTLDGEPHNGNDVALLKKGTQGKAFATTTDQTGREWWLVQIDPKFTVNKGFFHESEDSTLRACKIGWISSRFIKKL